MKNGWELPLEDFEINAEEKNELCQGTDPCCLREAIDWKA